MEMKHDEKVSKPCLFNKKQDVALPQYSCGNPPFGALSGWKSNQTVEMLNALEVVNSVVVSKMFGVFTPKIGNDPT